MGTTPAPWFTGVIVSGLQRLAAMRLPSTPLDGDLRLAAAVWIAALWARRAWDAERDAPRLEAAFLALASMARRWPAPAELLDYLPPRPQPPALPPPPPGPAALAHLAALKARFATAAPARPRAHPETGS